MKTKKLILFSAIAVSLIFGGAVAAVADVAIGETREAVFEALGEPEGYAKANGIEAYTFDRGKVLLRDGRVISHEIVSTEQAEQRRQEAEQRRDERMSEGNEKRDRMLDDETFAQAPARERLAYWRAFRQKYPDVDIGLEALVAAQQVDMDEREELRRIELQILEAEKTAELAKKYAPPVAPYGGSGLPLIYDPWHSAGGFTEKYILDDPYRDRVSVRVPPPPPPTGRERFMPLQERHIGLPSMVPVPQPQHRDHDGKAAHRHSPKPDRRHYSTSP